MNPIWFDGICDSLLFKMKRWYDCYERGKVRGTRQFLDTTGLKDVATKYLHEVPLSLKEAEALVRIMRAKRPKLPLTDMVAPIVSALRKYPMRMQGTTPVWVLPFAYYKPEVREIVKALEEAQADAKNKTLAPSVDVFVAEKKMQGGHLWER
jgi:hypothetical protein